MAVARTARIAAALPTLLAACATVPPPGLVTRGPREIALCGDAAGEPVQVTYLGVGGIAIRRGGSTLLFAPFYSHPSVWRVALALPLHPDADRVRALLPPLSDVRAILVGHAHYDHLLDLPVVLEQTPDAVVYGNATASHLLAPFLGRERRVALDAAADRPGAPGPWTAVDGGRVRVLAIESGHAPQIGPIELFEGRVEEDRRAPPRSAWGWKRGRPLAFLVDWLDEGGDVRFRLHYQDAASEPPLGIPTRERLAEAPVDLAVLCVGGSAGADGYPRAVLEALRPRHVLLGHWEDFFRDPGEPARVVRGTDLADFLARLERAPPAPTGWTLPEPGVTLTFRTCPPPG